MVMATVDKKAMEKEAFGLRVRTEDRKKDCCARYFYSKHNLQVKYQTIVETKSDKGTTKKQVVLGNACDPD